MSPNDGQPAENPTSKDMEAIAQMVARRELTISVKALAEEISKTIQITLKPHHARFSQLLQEQNKMVLLVNALVAVLIQKAAISREDIEREVGKLTNDAAQAFRDRLAAQQKSPVKEG